MFLFFLLTFGPILSHIINVSIPIYIYSINSIFEDEEEEKKNRELFHIPVHYNDIIAAK